MLDYIYWKKLGLRKIKKSEILLDLEFNWNKKFSLACIDDRMLNKTFQLDKIMFASYIDWTN